VNLITPLKLHADGSLYSGGSLAGGLSYCANQGGSRDGGWRTLSFVTGDAAALNTTEADDKWIAVNTSPATPGTYSGSVVFGTNCIKSVTFEFTMKIGAPMDVVTILIWMNEVQVARIVLVDESEWAEFSWDADVIATSYPVACVHSLPITLTDSQKARPCGNIFKISVEQIATGSEVEGGVSTYMEVIAVT